MVVVGEPFKFGAKGKGEEGGGGRRKTWRRGTTMRKKEVHGMGWLCSAASHTK